MKKIFIILGISVPFIIFGGIGYRYAYIQYKVKPETASKHASLAQSALDAGDSKTAELNARIAVSLNKNSGLAHLILARAMILNASVLREEALKHLLIAEKLGLNSASFYSELAGVQLEIEDWEGAEKSLEKSLSIAPENGRAIHYKILLLILRDKDYQVTLPLSISNAERNPQSLEATRMLALILGKNNLIEEAIAVIDEAIAKNPEYCPFYPVKADLIKSTSPEKADSLLALAERTAMEALQKDRSSQAANYCLANTYSIKGDLAALRSDPEELVRAFYEQAMRVNLPHGAVSDFSRQSALEALSKN